MKFKPTELDYNMFREKLNQNSKIDVLAQIINTKNKFKKSQFFFRQKYQVIFLVEIRKICLSMYLLFHNKIQHFYKILQSEKLKFKV